MKRELMIPVERAVRGLHAGHSRKMRMRQELYELIELRYQSVLESGVSEQAAVSKAIYAFGDPALIGDELRRSIPIVESLNEFLASSFTQNRFPLNWKQSLELGLRLGLPFFLFILVMEGILLAINHPNALLVIDVLLAIPVLFGMNAAQMSWTASRTVLALQQHRWTAVVIWSSLSSLLCIASLGVLYFLASPDFLWTSGWIRLLAGIPAAVVPYMLACWQLERERSESAPWDALEFPE